MSKSSSRKISTMPNDRQNIRQRQCHTEWVYHLWSVLDLQISFIVCILILFSALFTFPVLWVTFCNLFFWIKHFIFVFLFRYYFVLTEKSFCEVKAFWNITDCWLDTLWMHDCRKLNETIKSWLKTPKKSKIRFSKIHLPVLNTVLFSSIFNWSYFSWAIIHNFGFKKIYFQFVRPNSAIILDQRLY
jgi:hypothetical protein